MNRIRNIASMFALVILANEPLAAEEQTSHTPQSAENKPIYRGELVEDGIIAMTYNLPQAFVSAHPYSAILEGCRACHVASTELNASTLSGHIAFDLPIQSADPQMESLLSAALGELDESSCRLLDLKEGAVVVSDVCPSLKSPLKKHDVLRSVNGESITSLKDARKEVVKGSDTIELQVLRSGKTQTVTISHLQKKARTSRYRLGIALGELDPVVNSQLGLDDNVRVFVQSVLPDSAASGKLEVDDIVLSANGKPMETIEQLQSIVTDSKGSKIELRIQRQGKRLTVSIAAKETPVEVATYRKAVDLADAQAVPLELGYNAYPYQQAFQFLEKSANVARDSGVEQRLKALEEKLDQLIQLQKSQLEKRGQ